MEDKKEALKYYRLYIEKEQDSGKIKEVKSVIGKLK